MNNITLMTTDWRNDESENLVECYKLKYIGIYSICLFVLSLTVNITHLCILVNNKHLKQPVNLIVLSLTVVNLVGTIFDVPLVTLNAFNCTNIFGMGGCQFSAFVMYFAGCMNIYLLMAVSIQRYMISSRGVKLSKRLDYTKAVQMIFTCLVVSLFWALAPLFFWSYYSYEGVMITCSVEWYSRELNVISYNISMFIFVFIIPFGTFIITNIKILFIIKRSNKKIKHYGLSRSTMRNRLNKQKQITIMTIISFVCYAISWSPYATVSICRSFFNGCTVPPLMTTLPAYFAKLSLVWPAFVNLFINKTIR